MLRGILKLLAVGAVVTPFAFADSIELYAAGGGALLLLPFLIARLDRRARPVDEQPKAVRAPTTLDVIPLPAPMPAMSLPMTAAFEHHLDHGDDDIEGKTMRAPMTCEEAYEMHARYAPAFDQNAAIARYEAQHGIEAVPESVPEHDPLPMFDQRRYASALQYAEAFEAQLTRTRRTAAYQVAPPRRTARGSYSPQMYRATDTSTRAVDARSDQRAAGAMSPSDWDEKTLIGPYGAQPIKPGK